MDTREVFILTVAWISAVGTTAVVGQVPRFERENLRFTVVNDSCLVEGEYVFRNSGADSLFGSVVYPFPSAPDLPLPATVDVSRGDGTFLSLRVPADGQALSLPVSIAPWGVKRYGVRYRQGTPAKRMEYILTSTQTWGTPLAEADVVVMIPAHARLLSTTLPFDSCAVVDTMTRFYAHRVNFYPGSNLVFTWREMSR